MNEFQLIDRFFVREDNPGSVKVGIGDDGAVLATNKGQDLVVVTDTMVEGVHFVCEQPASALGHKILSVNLSDLAAMGAEPAWVTLNLVLPEANLGWLEQFSAGFFELADRYSVFLVGGDTTYGPLSVTATVGGWVPCGEAICRSKAKVGDLLYVSGSLGYAALGHTLLSEKRISIHDKHNDFLKRLLWPEPRILLGSSLRPLASAAIDVSDGLIADLEHITSASGELGALIDESMIPIQSGFEEFCSHSAILTMALTGGDDYELCFSVDSQRAGAIQKLSRYLNLPLTLIGHIDDRPGVRVIDTQGKYREVNSLGYLHQW